MTSSVTSWYQGTSHKVTTTCVNRTGQQIDVTGGSARFVFSTYFTNMFLFEKTQEAGIELSGQNGKVTVTVEPADIADLTPGDYRAQLEVTLLDGTVFIAYDLVITMKKNNAHQVTP